MKEGDMPKIYIPASRIPVLVYINKEGNKHIKVPVGNSFNERIGKLVDKVEKMGYKKAELIYRKNQYPINKSWFDVMMYKIDRLFKGDA